MPQLIVTPTIDSTMDYGSPDTNFGQSGTISQGVLIAGGSKNAVRRAIANFDVSPIPISAVIAQARMRRAISLADVSQHSVRIARCARPAQWTENGVTWNRYDGTNAWITGGGEYDDLTPAAVSFVEAVAPGQHEIAGLAGFVRDALDLRSGVVSVVLRNENEAPLVSERSNWLAGTFWELIIDYNVTADPGRRSAIDDDSARSGTRPSVPSEGQRPARPSSGKGGRRS